MWYAVNDEDDDEDEERERSGGVSEHALDGSKYTSDYQTIASRGFFVVRQEISLF